MALELLAADHRDPRGGIGWQPGDRSRPDLGAAVRPDRPGLRPAARDARLPHHPAGHTCISSATVHALQAFFGTDKIAFTAISNKCAPAPCPSRSFDRLSGALKEVIDARVWGGIHFRTADVQGSVLGKKVAHHLEKHYFRPGD